MKLSRYVLRYDTEDGSVYFNIKNNHSFLITNELKKNIQEKIRKNLALYAISGCYEDILDVD